MEWEILIPLTGVPESKRKENGYSFMSRKENKKWCSKERLAKNFSELMNQKCWTVVLEKTLESPLDCKEIQPVHPKGNQSWIVTGRTDVEVETLILWPPDAKSWLTGKDPDAGKDWRQEEKGTTEDELVGWHHRLNGHGFGWTLGAGDGQGGLSCCSPWACKESDMTERLNWTCKHVLNTSWSLFLLALLCYNHLFPPPPSWLRQ